MNENMSRDRVDAVIAELAQVAARDDGNATATTSPEPKPQRASSKGKVNKAQIPAPIVALATSLVFAALTLYNLSTVWATQELPPPTPEAAKADLAALATVESTLLQSHYETYGAYPQDPEEAGLDPEGIYYLRLSPHEFELTLESDGVAVTLNSKELARQARAEQEDNAEEDWQ